jgi:hypothetical protein
MDETPHQVGERPGELKAGGFGDSTAVADGGHRAPVGVLERAGRLMPGQPGPDDLADVFAFLHGRLGHAGQVVQGDHVPDSEDLRVAGQSAVRADWHPPGPVGGGSGLVREQARQRGGLHAGGPDPRLGPNDLAAAGGLDRDGVVVHVDGQGVQPDLHAHLLQLPLGVALQFEGEWRQD